MATSSAGVATGSGPIYHLMETLRQWERRCQGRQPEPSAGSVDSQSIKTATQNEDIGFDGYKRIKGRKRHILVDTLGLIIEVVVTDAGVDDREGLVELLTAYVADGVKRLRKLWVDGSDPAEWLEEWVRGLKQTHKMALESTPNPEGKGFQVVPWRWAVEVSQLYYPYPDKRLLSYYWLNGSIGPR
jgi:putative transposase